MDYQGKKWIQTDGTEIGKLISGDCPVVYMEFYDSVLDIYNNAFMPILWVQKVDAQCILCMAVWLHIFLACILEQY